MIFVQASSCSRFAYLRSDHFPLIGSHIHPGYPWGRIGGLVVSVLAIYSDDPSSIPTLATYFVGKTKIKEKEAGIGPSIKKPSGKPVSDSLLVCFRPTYLWQISVWWVGVAPFVLCWIADGVAPGSWRQSLFFPSFSFFWWLDNRSKWHLTD